MILQAASMDGLELPSSVQLPDAMDITLGMPLSRRNTLQGCLCCDSDALSPFAVPALHCIIFKLVGLSLLSTVAGRWTFVSAESSYDRAEGQRHLTIVIDTNVLVEKLSMLQQICTAFHTLMQKGVNVSAKVVIPGIVLAELDGLKRAGNDGEVC